MIKDYGSGTSDSGYEIRNSGSEIRDTGLETRDLRCGIQDSFAGYKFEDVIKMDEKEKAEEKKKLEDIARENAKRNQDKNGNKQDDENSSNVSERSVQGSRSFAIEEEKDAFIVYESITSKGNIIPELRETHRYTKEFMYDGEKHNYTEWDIHAKMKNKSEEFVPASLTEFHTLARAAYEDRKSSSDDRQEASKNARIILYGCLTGEIGFYTMLRTINGIIVEYPIIDHQANAIHSEHAYNDVRMLQYPASSLIRTERDPTRMKPGSIDSRIICKTLFGDMSVQRVIDIYSWIETWGDPTIGKREINMTNIRDFAIPQLKIGNRIKLDMEDCRPDTPYKTIGVIRKKMPTPKTKKTVIYL